MTVVRDLKDISMYVSESIRNIYGIITEVQLSKYPDMTSKEIAKEVLRGHLTEREIDERLDRYLEDLPYSYYNVAWSDRIVVMDGAQQLLDSFKKKEIGLGIATGEPQRVAKMRLEKVGLDKHFTFGTYAEDGFSPKEILESGMDRISSEMGLAADQGAIFTTSPRFVSAAKALGLYAIGVAANGASKETLKSEGAAEIIGSLKDKTKFFSRA